MKKSNLLTILLTIYNLDVSPNALEDKVINMLDLIEVIIKADDIEEQLEHFTSEQAHRNVLEQREQIQRKHLERNELERIEEIERERLYRNQLEQLESTEQQQLQRIAEKEKAILAILKEQEEKEKLGEKIVKSTNLVKEQEDTAHSNLMKRFSTESVNIRQEEINKFKKFNASKHSLENIKTIIAAYEKCKNNQTLDHELFSKYDIPTILDTSLKNLLVIFEEMRFDQPSLLSAARITENQRDFIANMDTLYSHIFKKQWAGNILNRYLVIKHKFNKKADGSVVPELTDKEAITILTKLIILWEIYKNLFEKFENDENFKFYEVKLNYFGITKSPDDWSLYTRNAGFTKKAQFDSPDENSEDTSSPLEKSLEGCMKEPSPVTKLSLPNIRPLLSNLGHYAKDAAFATTKAVQNAALATKRSVQNAASATTRSIKERWAQFTKKIEDEADDL